MHYVEHIPMLMFDAHTHIDMRHFKNDREQVIQRSRDAGLVGMVTSSINPGSFRRTLGIIKKHKDFIFHSAGCSASQVTKDEAEQIISLGERTARKRCSGTNLFDVYSACNRVKLANCDTFSES